jgi:mono/diheme cytochrome c family protein
MKLLVLVAFLLLPVPAHAEPEDLGRQVYRDACANCHGQTGRGDGPNAGSVSATVPDLALLAQGNGGDFDVGRVIRTIDGSAGLASHGGPMPMFGGLLTGRSVEVTAADGTPVVTTEPILAVARWLKTLQVEE